MRITKLQLGKSMKLSINYQSAQASVGVEVELENGESIEDVRDEVSEMVDDILKEEIKKQIGILHEIGGAI